MEAITFGWALASVLSGMPVRQKPARSGAVHRTGAPVLRNSIEAGTFEESFFGNHSTAELNKLLTAARTALDEANGLRRIARRGERKLTVAERILATLTEKFVRIFQEILTLARLNQGKVYPSYEYLSDKTNLGRATISRGLAALEAIGFIVRQRRFKRIAAEGAGPRYQQTSNAYRPALPSRALALLPRWMRPAPIPVDAEQHHADQMQTTQSMLATLSCKELAEATISGPLGKVLARLGAGVDRAERESHDGSQPLIDSINYA